MEIEKLIQKSSFLNGFSEKNRSKILETGKLKSLKKKNILFLEGETGHAFYLLVEGNIQLSKTTPDGKEIVIKVIKPGEIFAEVILFEKNDYPVTARAILNSKIFVIEKNTFLDLLDEKSFRNEFIITLIRKQKYLTDQIKYLTVHDVEDRLFSFLREQYGSAVIIKTAMSKKDIAAAIGATPETLSRLLLRLSNEGKLIWEGKTIKLF